MIEKNPSYKELIKNENLIQNYKNTTSIMRYYTKIGSISKYFQKKK